MSKGEVIAVREAGSRLVVSPSMNREVIRETKAIGMIGMPGVFTPTEAFQGIENGADGLKFFPANVSRPSTIKGWRAVLPKTVLIIAIGGIDDTNIMEWKARGCVGLGSSLYKPGYYTRMVQSKINYF